MYLRFYIFEEVTVCHQGRINHFIAIAMLLMGMGYKGEEFATRMHLKHDAANRIRNQVLGTAPEGISDFDQIDTQNFSANKVGDTEYYRAEAQKALETLLKMYF